MFGAEFYDMNTDTNVISDSFQLALTTATFKSSNSFLSENIASISARAALNVPEKQTIKFDGKSAFH